MLRLKIIVRIYQIMQGNEAGLQAKVFQIFEACFNLETIIDCGSFVEYFSRYESMTNKIDNVFGLLELCMTEAACSSFRVNDVGVEFTLNC